MENKISLYDAAEIYACSFRTEDKKFAKSTFKDAVSSNAAKEYWYAQWQLEQKKVPTDEQIEKLAEKEYPYANESVFNSWKRFNHYQSINRKAFIKGFKSALQYAKPSAGVWVKASEHPSKNGRYYCKHVMYKSEIKYVYEFNDGLWLDDGMQLKQSFLWLDESALQYSVGDGWIDVKDRLPTDEDAYNDKYDEVLTIQVGRQRPTMMKYWEIKHCPFTKYWMPIKPPINKQNGR